MSRWVIALPLAIACVSGLFLLMAAMVTPTTFKDDENKSGMVFDLVMQEPEMELNRRQRDVPPKPEEPQEPMSQPAQAAAPQTQTQTLSSPLPQLSFDMQVEGISISAPTFEQPVVAESTVGEIADVSLAAPIASDLEGSSNQQAMPMYRSEPSYPAKALRRRIEGYVVIRFTIDETGRPQDLEVVEASPKRVFERDAMRALKRWKYQPKRLDGKAIKQPNQTAKIEFKLAK
ncbi:energy transducer TonB [Enterovibrio norvegicus]|uniref:energy transducer TonB n=1 Tax=Enterovibrio norvegicus TaxID=188144 RepID=UPI00352E7C7A